MLNKEKKQEILEKLKDAQKVLVGIGPEWEKDTAYEELFELIKDKDYFVVTTLTDGAIYNTGFDKKRMTAPCGNVHWRQCSG